MKELAASTGGASFFPGAEQLEKTLDQVSTEIENQYSFGYYTKDLVEGWRTIDISLTPPMEDTTLRYQNRYLFK